MTGVQDGRAGRHPTAPTSSLLWGVGLQSMKFQTLERAGAQQDPVWPEGPVSVGWAVTAGRRRT